MEHTLPIRACFMYNKAQYEKWLKLRWLLLHRWHRGEHPKVLPCMVGIHYMLGQEYVLKMT